MLCPVDAESGKDFRQGHLEMLFHMASGFQFKEEGIVEHLRRIAAYVETLSGSLGWSESKIRMLKHASVFHDVGMVDIPESILKKEGALNDEEMEVLRRHAEFGRALLRESGVPLLDMGAYLAYTHHERFDGTGYPRKISGEAIPISARVLAVADVFDALTSRRPFKEPYPVDVALELITSKSGSHFDPEVVTALLGCEKGFREICEKMATSRHPTRKGFRISARDRSKGELFSIARDGYFACPYCKQLHPHDQVLCPETQLELTEIHKLSGIVIEDKYRLRGALGVGGMGVVYEALHVLIGRKLAIKFLKPEVARHKNSITRFYNEARVYSTVGHSNLVEVTDMGWTDGRIPYIVMEMLEGTDLCELLVMSGRMKVITAVTILIEVLRTLDAVHDKGIVHRDLKPENIYLTREDGEDRLKILDFGISRLVTPEDRKMRLTQEGIVFGTPIYMSPEQAQGSGYIDGRSDLFTMGAIFYEMLTGWQAFKGDNPLSIISSICRGEYRPPGEIIPDLPDEIKAIVTKALAVNREERYQNAGEFMEPLVSFARRDRRFEEGKILDLFRPVYSASPESDGEGAGEAGEKLHGKSIKGTRRSWYPSSRE